MPWLAYRERLPASPAAVASFETIRARFQVAGFGLVFNHSARAYQARRGGAVVMSFATLASARRWLNRTS